MARSVTLLIVWALGAGVAAADLRLDIVEQVSLAMPGRKPMSMGGKGTRRTIVIKGARRLTAGERTAELVDLESR